MISFFQFITMAFPKAGALVSGVPVTASTILFVLVLMRYFPYSFLVMNKIRGVLPVYIAFCVFAVLAVIINLDAGEVSKIAEAFVLMASPLAIGIGYKAKPRTVIKIIKVSLLIVALYAVAQFNWGVVATTVEGLNVAMGDSLTNKPIGYGLSDDREALKMPTTYQNGNAAGLFYLLSIPILLASKTYGVMQNIYKYTCISAGITGLLLSGSRSALFPCIMGIPFLWLYLKRKLSYSGQLKLIFCTFVFLSASVIYLSMFNSELVDFFFDRYFIQTINDPTGANRTTLYSVLFERISNLSLLGQIEVLFFGLPWKNLDNVEGVAYILAFYGAIAFVLFLLLLFLPLRYVYKANKVISVGTAAVFIAFLIDKSFCYPPALILYFYVVGLTMSSRELTIKLAKSESNKNNDEMKNNYKKIIHT